MAASIYLDQAYYIFGSTGSTRSNLSYIARLDAVRKSWSLAGVLNKGRSGHGVIFDGMQFLVVGGYGTTKIEKCITNGETVTCTQIGKGLYNYAYYPELRLVADNYGNDC